jgi:hypothetical protein
VALQWGLAEVPETRPLSFLVKDLEIDVTIRAARTACVEIMNGLVEAGPGWTVVSFQLRVVRLTSKGVTPQVAPAKHQVYINTHLRNVPATEFQTSGIWYTISQHKRPMPTWPYGSCYA